MADSLRLGAASILVATAMGLAASHPASAHHNTVSCTDRATSTWTITNSEFDKTEDYTTDQGHSGSIAAGGADTVVYNGMSLTVYGTWNNGVTNTSTGTGNCVPEQTTTTTVAPTTTTVAPTTTTVAPTTTQPHRNQVDDWCPSGGVKYEPVDTPFIVPAPPEGTTWTLLVLKAGSGPDENATFPNPVAGQGYSHPSGKANSHAILCGEQTQTTTTEASTTTTEAPATTEGTTTTTTETPAVPTPGDPIPPQVGGASGSLPAPESQAPVAGATPTTDPAPAGMLPQTGTPTQNMAMLASAFVLLGGGVLLATRTRRQFSR